MKKERLLCILLTLALTMCLMPCMSMTALADGPAYNAYLVTTSANSAKSGAAQTALQVTFNEKPWYIIEDNSTSATEGTVTLLAADTSFGVSTFAGTKATNAYSSSDVKGVLDALTAPGGSFADVADAIANTDLSDVSVTGAKLYLLSVAEVTNQRLPANYRTLNFTSASQNGSWWLRSAGTVTTF